MNDGLPALTGLMAITIVFAVVVLPIAYLPGYIRSRKLKDLAKESRLEFKSRKLQLSNFSHKYKKNVISGKMHNKNIEIYDCVDNYYYGSPGDNMAKRATLISCNGKEKEIKRKLPWYASTKQIRKSLSDLRMGKLLKDIAID